MNICSSPLLLLLLLLSLINGLCYLTMNIVLLSPSYDELNNTIILIIINDGEVFPSVKCKRILFYIKKKEKKLDYEDNYLNNRNITITNNKFEKHIFAFRTPQQHNTSPTV